MGKTREAKRDQTSHLGVSKPRRASNEVAKEVKNECKQLWKRHFLTVVFQAEQEKVEVKKVQNKPQEIWYGSKCLDELLKTSQLIYTTTKNPHRLLIQELKSSHSTEKHTWPPNSKESNYIQKAKWGQVVSIFLQLYSQCSFQQVKIISFLSHSIT